MTQASSRPLPASKASTAQASKASSNASRKSCSYEKNRKKKLEVKHGTRHRPRACLCRVPCGKTSSKARHTRHRQVRGNQPQGPDQTDQDVRDAGRRHSDGGAGGAEVGGVTDRRWPSAGRGAVLFYFGARFLS